MSGWLSYPRIPAMGGNYAKGRQGYRDIWMVIHCTDDDYADNYPANLGGYWSRTKTQVSVHFGVSDTMTRQYVSMDDTAYQARNPANLRGVGVELSGLSAWTRNEWLAHKPMLRRAATLCVEVAIARGYDLTPIRVTGSRLRARGSGLTQHADLTAAFGGSHTDLGKGFPWDYFGTELSAALARLHPGAVFAPAKPAAVAPSRPATVSGKDALVAVSEAEFRLVAAQVAAIHATLVTGKLYPASDLAKELGYVVSKVQALSLKVEAANAAEIARDATALGKGGN